MGLNNENAVVADMAGTPWLVFDIETCPMPDCADYLTDPIEAPSNYKDPLKIAAYIEEQRLKQIAKAALDLDLCEIAAIGYGHHTAGFCEITRAEMSEAEMLRAFWALAARQIMAHGVLVGFNCLHFDLPALLRRSLYLGIPAPKVQVDKYRHDGVIDIADVLTFGGKTTWRSLGFYAKRFGIAHDDSVRGEDVPALVAAGRWDTVAAHVRADVATTTTLAQRIGLIAAPVREPDAALVA